jgi:hypothetical protein
MEAWYVGDACGRTVLQDVHHSTLSGLSLYKGIERAVANPEQWEQSGRLCHPLKAEGCGDAVAGSFTRGASGETGAVTAAQSKLAPLAA